MPEKKEEEFAVNLSKKSHGEEDPFLAARFVSVQFRQRQASCLRSSVTKSRHEGRLAPRRHLGKGA
jgi:hypothetical protein